MSGLILSATAAPFVQTDLTDTVESLYQRYASIVLADGGEIIEPATVRAVIAKLMELGIPVRSAVMVSARFGLKKSGTSILRMYALDGTALDPVNDDGSAAALTYATASYAYKTFEFSAPNAYLKSTVKKAFVPTEEVAIMIVAQPPGAGTDRITAMAFEDMVSPNSHLAMYHSMNATWRTKGYVDRAGTHITLERTAGYAGSTLSGFHVSLGTKQVIQNIVGSAVFATVANGSGIFIPDLSSREGYILIGGRYSTGGRYNMDNSGTSRWGIGAIVPGATMAQTVALMAYIDALF